MSRQTDEYSPMKKKTVSHKRTFLSALAVMNKKFIANLVARIWGSYLTRNSIDTVTNIWLKFQTKIPKEYSVVSPRQRVNKIYFPKTKCPGISSPYLLFVICLWTCLFTWLQITYETTCVNFFSATRA